MMSRRKIKIEVRIIDSGKYPPCKENPCSGLSHEERVESFIEECSRIWAKQIKRNKEKIYG